MPTAERRRKAAGRTPTKSPKPAPRARGPKPAAVLPAPVEALPPEPGAVGAPAAPELDPAAWRDIREDAPFDMRRKRERAGPFDLMLPDGTAASRRFWGFYMTDSGGRTWGWVAPGAQPIARHVPIAWRTALN